MGSLQVFGRVLGLREAGTGHSGGERAFSIIPRGGWGLAGRWRALPLGKAAP